MKIKALLFSAALIAAPGWAVAEGCEHEFQSGVLSCAQGESYDFASGTCIPIVNS